MYKNKSILAIVVARGGSKGVPGKNIRLVGGKPLLAWTIEGAQQSKVLDRVILSCDDDGIIEVARQYGLEVPFVRPKEFAKDESPVSEAIIHALDNISGYDYVVLLQPTSPLRTAEDIDECLKVCVDSLATSAISVSQPEESPYWMLTKDAEGWLRPLLSGTHTTARRQDVPEVLLPNGAIYVAEVDYYREHKTFVGDKTVGYEMQRETVLDIDTEKDFLLFETILMNREGDDS